MAARIVTVVDVFQTLAQKRPYRGTRPAEEIFVIPYGYFANGVLHDDVVAVATQDMDASWSAATRAP